MEQDAQNHGMNLRFSFAPYPLVGRPREVLRKYVEGNDPVTGRPLMPQVVEALTRPLSPEESSTPRAGPGRSQAAAAASRTRRRVCTSSSWRTAGPTAPRSFCPPKERVAHMLTGTAADPDEVVGRMTVTIHQEKLEYTVEKVAVNAVMAGAGPEHLPVILALAASEEASMPSSTTSFGGWRS